MRLVPFIFPGKWLFRSTLSNKSAVFFFFGFPSTLPWLPLVSVSEDRRWLPLESTFFLVYFRDLDAFSKLLLGPGISDLVSKVTRTRDRRKLEPSEILNEFRYSIIANTELQQVLQAAKRAFSISDSSGAIFKSLTDEMANKHPILEELLERVLNDDWTGLDEVWTIVKRRRKKKFWQWN